MSGFFMLERNAFHRCVCRLSALGLKILVDIFASGPEPLRFKELPYTFGQRVAGESKLDNHAALDDLMLLLDKSVGHIVPVRFFSFAMIGALGLGVHMAVLIPTFTSGALPFAIAQATATITAMSFNFAVNNQITYRDKRLRGLAWIRGLVSFAMSCSVGAFANVGIANYLFIRNQAWLLASVAGVVVGAVWNYAVTSLYTWGKA